jgi:hypothetical protein
VTLTADITKFAFPVLVIATVFVPVLPTVTLPKESETGDTLIAGAAVVTPVPVNDTAVGEPLALLEIVADPVTLPAV